MLSEKKWKFCSICKPVFTGPFKAVLWCIFEICKYDISLLWLLFNPCSPSLSLFLSLSVSERWGITCSAIQNITADCNICLVKLKRNLLSLYLFYFYKMYPRSTYISINLLFQLLYPYCYKEYIGFNWISPKSAYPNHNIRK